MLVRTVCGIESFSYSVAAMFMGHECKSTSHENDNARSRSSMTVCSERKRTQVSSTKKRKHTMIGDYKWQFTFGGSRVWEFAGELFPEISGHGRIPASKG